MIIRLVALSVLMLIASTASARPFTARDLAMIERVSDPRLSPDGTQVAINVRSTDYDENRGINALRLIDRGSGRATTVVSGEKAPTSPRWSSDRQLYFISGRSGSQQLWRRGADGALMQVTAFPLDVGAFRLAPDARSAVVVIDARPECDTLACTRTAEDAKAKLKATGILVPDSRQPRFWDTYDDGRSTGLFRIALGTGGAPAEAVALTKRWLADVPEKPGGDDGSMTVARDGMTVYFASRDPGAAQGDDTQTHLWAVAADGSSAPRRLIPASTTWDSQPVLSPDGRSLAYIAKAQNRIYTRTAPMLFDLASGRTRPIVPGGDLFLRKLAWSADGRTLLATGEAVGQVPLYAIDVTRGTMRTLVANGQVSDFDAVGGATVYVADSLAGPGELYDLTASGTPRALTSVGATIAAAAPPAPAEQFTFTGYNGATVHGYVVKPQGFVARQRYPVAFLIHGGPHGSFGNGWSYRWNPQVWAGMGFAVVMVDFHGSSGYGEAFGQSVVGAWGGPPLDDLQKGWAAALARYDWLDGDRACALGGSYGGYMVNWIASQWATPWKCFVNHAGVFDTRVMAYSTDIPAFSEAQQRGLTMKSSETQGRYDPSDHVALWRVPMLVTHGARDFRVPLDQGIAAHTALRRAKVPAELLVFPDENHWVLKPQNSVQWYATVEAWMKRWTAPVRRP